MCLYTGGDYGWWFWDGRKLKSMTDLVERTELTLTEPPVVFFKHVMRKFISLADITLLSSAAPLLFSRSDIL
jgi:hypothetical protein